MALVTAARKLRPYFEVPTEYPMKQVLHIPETSGMLMKWAIELSEFDIRYKPKTAIKGHVLANFVMEFTSIEPTENNHEGPLSRQDPFERIQTESGMPLKSLNHSKSYLCGSDFKIGQAHKNLHLTKYIYNEGIQAFSK